ncbi:MAG: alanine--tRNA ligase [Alphaproteobacteria bacterium]|nr:alanine--tRNA ligase [Alphaproteobacteria bacterium]
MKLNDIRKTYTDFFQERGHTLVKSSSLVPQNDPTLLFTNAGMNQFKDVFTGKEKREYTRATTAQKCVRAGGKHNDLDNVGYTTRHHTFFEMLGNFSFGDYFKEQAITYAWEFLSKVLKLEKDRLYFTVYPEDTEARELWKKIADVPDSRVIDIKDNIWAMGDVGPCGFDTEMFYDKGPEVAGGLPGTPDEDGDRYIEIWNNVFMQYETLPTGEKVELKNKNIDTGMGLERIASVLQGVDDNFKIDLFQNLMKYEEEILGVKRTEENTASFKVIADHIRATSFLIADGVLPSNEGRGYVLRRIMRRALRHINMLGVKEPAFYKLFDNVKEQMADTYPELIEAEALIKQTIKTEEENFGQTLDAGLKILDSEISKTSGKVLSGESAFKLYDTYGFPLDLTADILRNRNMTVDTDGFDKAMAEQRNKSKKASNFKGEAGNQKIWYDVKSKVGTTEFVGYTDLSSTSKVKAVVKNGAIEEKATMAEGDEIFVIVDKTPFYAECGGQVSDRGTVTKNGKTYTVSDVKKAVDNVYFHKIDLPVGDEISVGDTVEMNVDVNARKRIMANHSATHLLQKALQEIVGKNVAQKGSWVGENGLRFDFANPKALTFEQIQQVEKLVNKYIADAMEISKKEMPIDEAKATGAMALFGEKYGDIVRVVNMGGVSIELCGGTHCDNTKEIGFFKILKEESVASGVRRIEAISLNDAFDMAKKYGLDTTKSPDVLIVELQEKQREEKVAEQDKLAREFEEKRKQEIELQNKQIDTVVKGVKSETVNNINFVYGIYDNVSAKILKPATDTLRKDVKNTVILLIASEGAKVSVLTAVSGDLTGKISAVDLVKKSAEMLGGHGGGGRPDLAQAGGTDASKSLDVVAMIKTELGNI